MMRTDPQSNEKVGESQSAMRVHLLMHQGCINGFAHPARRARLRPPARTGSGEYGCGRRSWDRSQSELTEIPLRFHLSLVPLSPPTPIDGHASTHGTELSRLGRSHHAIGVEHTAHAPELRPGNHRHHAHPDASRAALARPACSYARGTAAAAASRPPSSRWPRDRRSDPHCSQKRLVIESQWVPKPLASAGNLRRRRLNNKPF
jgi:hypothetical protein